MNYHNIDVGKKNEVERKVWLEKTLKNIPEKSKILDAGAGTQQYKEYCEHLVYVSQDFAEYDGKGNNSGLQTDSFDYGKLDIVSDITSIPEKDASFDAIMCTEVLEHLPDPALAIKEFSRLLKSEATLILTAPFCSLTHFAPYHFSTGFNRYWYQEHLSKNGLEILEMIPNGNYFEYLGQETDRINQIARIYSKTKIRFYEKWVLSYYKKMLKRFSSRDNSSSELLCYGYHVLAIKK